MNKIYKVALIGCGHMGEVHLQDIYSKENVSIKYVCDIKKSRAQSFKRKYGALNAVTDYTLCIADEEIDVVIIATYPSTHLDIAALCFANGKHIICEKPLAQSMAQAQEFVRLAEAHSHCKILIGHILRHNDTYNQVRSMIQDGAIGSPIVMRMVQNHHTMNWDKYLTLIKETSPIIDCGVHYLDVMQWFTGARIVQVSGIGAKTEMDIGNGEYNYGLLTAKLSDGSIGYYEAGWSNTISSENVKEFFGPKGRIKIVLQRDRTSNQEEGDLIEYYRYPQKTYRHINMRSKRKPTGDQFDYLINMIENNIEAVPTLNEGFQCFLWAVCADKMIRESL